MNREIEFRGKRCADGEWVYGDYVAGDSCDVSFIFPRDITSLFCVGGRYEVDENTVGEFTGLKDKNGVKIFEGDILDVTVFDCFDNDEQYKVVVEWVGTEFVGVDVNTYGSVWNMDWLRDQDDEIEVIGNIHDAK